MSLEASLKHEARSLGFDLVGIAPATEADGFERLQEWLARGFAGEMGYMSRHGEARRHPSSILPCVRSVIMVGITYNSQPCPGTSASVKIARYAQGPDYHDVLKERLRSLLAWLQSVEASCEGRAVVDTAPLLERDFARRAGLGWFGKNTMLINKRLGSFLFLGALLVSLELRPDTPHQTSHCGTCTACLEACPTQAFQGAGWLDARRCISYLTIELRGMIPFELREQTGDWLFGCDICQEVCPWNRHPADGAFPHDPELVSVDPLTVLSMSEEEFRSRFRYTALNRTKRSGLRRNAAIVLGNIGTETTLPDLERYQYDEDEIVREAVLWAIDHIRGK